MKNSGWILFGIAVCFIILLMLCNKADKEDTVTKAEYEALQAQVKDTVKYYQAYLEAEQHRRDSAIQARTDLQQQLAQSTEKEKASRAIALRLAAQVQAAKSQQPDNTFVRVSPAYVQGCDSLANHIADLGKMVDQQNDDGAKLNELMLYEISIRDSAINAQKDFNQKFMGQLDNCLEQLQTAVKQQPRNQVYAGIGVFGNQINPLAGGQVNISLKTKSNKIFEVTGATVGNTWYGGVGAKFLLSFRR
jgi:hypothetical protein